MLLFPLIVAPTPGKVRMSECLVYKIIMVRLNMANDIAQFSFGLLGQKHPNEPICVRGGGAALEHKSEKYCAGVSSV